MNLKICLFFNFLFILSAFTNQKDYPVKNGINVENEQFLRNFFNIVIDNESENFTVLNGSDLTQVDIETEKNMIIIISQTLPIPPKFPIENRKKTKIASESAAPAPRGGSSTANFCCSCYRNCPNGNDFRDCCLFDSLESIPEQDCCSKQVYIKPHL